MAHAGAIRPLVRLLYDEMRGNPVGRVLRSFRHALVAGLWLAIKALFLLALSCLDPKDRLPKDPQSRKQAYDIKRRPNCDGDLTTTSPATSMAVRVVPRDRNRKTLRASVREEAAAALGNLVFYNDETNAGNQASYTNSPHT